MGRIGQWKEQSDKKRSRMLRIWGAVVGFILLLFLLGWGISYISGMWEPASDSADGTDTKESHIEANASASGEVPSDEMGSGDVQEGSGEEHSEILPENTEEKTSENAIISSQEMTTAPSEISQEKTDSDYIELIAVGDNLMHRSLSEAGQLANGTWDYTSVYAPMWSLISGADIAVLNQEVPMAGADYGIQTYPRFNAPQQLAATLNRMGFDVVTFATNHMLDQGRQGLKNTVEYWNTRYPNVLTVGAYTSEEQRNRVSYVTCKGAKIAFLNYTYGTNSGNVGKETYLINYMKEELIRSDIAAAKEVCDFVIVCMHWGTENHTVPDEKQYYYANVCAGAGADVIIGTHPHVVQPVSFVTAANGNRTLVFYSLGNFVSLQDRAERMLGGIAKLRLRVETDEAGNVTVIPQTYELDFLVMHYTYNPDIPAYDHMVVFPWEQYTEALAETHGLHAMGISFSLSSLQKRIDALGEVSGSFVSP